MTLPLTLLFHVSSESLRAGTYRTTIGQYHTQLLAATSGQPAWAGLPRPHAYVRITDSDKPGLSEHIEDLYELDVMPIVEDGAQLAERGGRSDLLHALDRPELQAQPFVFHVGSDTRVQVAAGRTLFQLLSTAVHTLHGNHQVLSVGFSPAFSLFPTRQVSDVYSAVQGFRTPAITRTRDLYLAAHLAHGQSTPETVLGAFSHSPARHLAFNSTFATTL